MNKTASMTAEDVIRTHTEGFNRALMTHDLDALSAIYADDYMLVRPDGSVLGKEDVLRDLGAGGLRFTSIDLANVSVRIYGQTALLTGDSRTVTSRNGDEVTALIRLLAVYVYDGSRLRLAHFQSASLPA
jgi:ketosteroid isomerase-like protein